MHDGDSEEALPDTLSREAIIEREYAKFCIGLGLQSSMPNLVSGSVSTSIVTHQLLLQKLQSDAAMAALLPGAQCFVSLGRERDMPFRLKSTSLLLVPPTLLASAPALAAVTRWGFEGASVLQRGELNYSKLLCIVKHGASLLKMLTIRDRAMVLNSMPDEISREVIGSRLADISPGLMSWMLDILGVETTLPIMKKSEVILSELYLPIEYLLSSNGDSRLWLDARTGKNRYGTTVRPRPEAVHFSSSTASSISDHGFMACDVLRRDLALLVLEKRDSNHGVRRALSDALIATLRELCGLTVEEADGVITPSGTDAEVISVLLALSAGQDRPLANLLVSPEETGRGVKLAAAGCYFDDQSSTGVAITKGHVIWPGAQISVLNVSLRDSAGKALDLADIDTEFEMLGMTALEQGCRVLAHVLLGSKTGLSGPSLTVVEKLVAAAPDRVDVVVDACQMRIDFHELGALVQRGWMVQLSGSKALTGPAFSGAILFPLSMRERIAEVISRMQPGVGYAEDWSSWWAANMDPTPDPPQFGAPIRWLPALIEAELARNVPEERCHAAFCRFRDEAGQRLRGSSYLQLLETHSNGWDQGRSAHPLADSIVSFQVFARQWDGSITPMGIEGCRRIFELLNDDVRDLFADVSLAQQSMLSQEFHIGQPVELGTAEEGRVILRLVIGVRFFNIVAYAGPGAMDAALESEISDLIRAIDKLEFLAANWWRICNAVS